MAKAPEELGSLLDTKHWDRKKILEWEFRAPHGLAANAIERLGEPKADISIKRADDGVIFVADSKWFGESKRRNEITDKSLAGLRRQVEAMFRDQILAHTQVVWEDWLEIKISGREQNEEEKSGAGERDVRISYETLKRARFPDGRDMVLEHRSLLPFPEAKALGVEGPQYRKRNKHGFGYDSSVYSQDDSTQYAYIPATPENIDAINALFGKIDELNARLASILNQQAIKRTVSLLLNGGTLALEKK